MKKQSLFGKYIWVFFICFFMSIVILGAVLFASVNQYLRNDKYELLERNAVWAAALTADNYTKNGYRLLNRSVLESYYYIFSLSIDAEIVLTDLEGNPLLGAGNEWEQQEQLQVSQEIVDQAIAGEYRGIGNMGGFFDEPHYIVGVPVTVKDDTVVGLMFASATAKGLQDVMGELRNMFLFGALIVLFVAFVLIYIVTYRLIRPLKDMVQATHSFSQGDFTKRVPISSFDEIGQLAMAFNNMASTLATTEGTRRSFVANVSHELKTPMTTISGFVDGILDGTVPEEKRDQYLHVVSNEVKRLSRLVRSMLDTAKIEAGEMVIHPTLFDVSEIIRQTVFSFEQPLEEKRVELRGLEIDKVMIFADIDLMHQVVYNLVENAVKFVNVDGYIEFRYQTTGQAVYVAIRNSGAGLDKEEVPQLFERFYKSDKSRSLNKDGAGLGLHIVKSLVNYHKGEIVVRSVEGEYTEFEFSVPIQTDRKKSKEPREIREPKEKKESKEQDDYE